MCRKCRSEKGGYGEKPGETWTRHLTRLHGVQDGVSESEGATKGAQSEGKQAPSSASSEWIELYARQKCEPAVVEPCGSIKAKRQG